MKKFEVGKRYVWSHHGGTKYIWECIGRGHGVVNFRNCTFGGVIERRIEKALDLKNIVMEAVKIIPNDIYSFMDVDDELV